MQKMTMRRIAVILACLMALVFFGGLFPQMLPAALAAESVSGTETPEEESAELETGQTTYEEPGMGQTTFGETETAPETFRETSSETEPPTESMEPVSETPEKIATDPLAGYYDALEDAVWQGDRIAQGNYTEESYQNLQKELEAAQKMLSEGSADAEQVEDQIHKISLAIYELEEEGDEEEGDEEDKTELKALVQEARSLDLSAYTQESAAAFQAVILSAEAVTDDKEADAKAIEKQTTLLKNAAKALMEKDEEGVVYDGIYTIDGQLHHASADQLSMGNQAIVKPMQVIMENGKATLRLEMVPLTASLGKKAFTGYLYQMHYFPGWEGIKAPTSETPVAVTVEDYYENLYDDYNDPKTGLDTNIRGKFYPHYLTLPVDYQDQEIWVQVYVPVMEAISAGSGTQFAKLQLDWSTLTQIAGTGADMTALETALGDARAMRRSLKEGDGGYTKENVYALDEIIAGADAAVKELNLSQETVDATAELLLSAMDLFDVVSLSVEPASLSLKTGESQSLQVSVINGNGYMISFKTSDEQVASVTSGGMVAAVSNGSAVITVTASKSGCAEIVREIKVTVTGDQKEDDTSDYKNLSDGVYTVHGDMVKVDKETPSMSDDAINHDIKLTVKEGIYYLTMDFKGLKVGTDFGYLGTLKYFVTGYKTDSYGAPQGTTEEVKVEAFQLNDDGSKVKDDYGTDYPDVVTFPMIPETLEDGYVPLQVFVPIMEAISKGNGTQAVYLKLNWSTLKQGFRQEEESSEETSPAVDLQDRKTGIRVHADEGILPKGVKLVAEEIKNGTAYDTAKSNMFISGKQFVLYDIHFEDTSGREVQPEGRVTVGIPVPSGWDSTKLALYHFTESGTASPIVGSAADNVYTFSTFSFSPFALVQRSGSGLEESTGGLPTTKSQLPTATTGLKQGSSALKSVKTGDETSVLIWVILIAAATATIAAWFIARKKKGKAE